MNSNTQKKQGRKLTLVKKTVSVFTPQATGLYHTTTQGTVTSQGTTGTLTTFMD